MQQDAEQLVQAVIDANRDRLRVMLAPHATVDLVQIERDYLLNLVAALAKAYPKVAEYLVSYCNKGTKMSKYTAEQIRRVVRMSNIYCSAKDQECIRIDYTEDTYFIGKGEETGEDYHVEFEEIDLDEDSFYMLVPVDVKSVL